MENIPNKFREIDSFHFTNFLTWTFLNFLAHCARVWTGLKAPGRPKKKDFANSSAPTLNADVLAISKVYKVSCLKKFLFRT